MNKLRLFVLPGIAALSLAFFFFACARNAVAAELVGPDSAWAKAIVMHAPGPAGPPLTIKQGPCPGVPAAGGCWTGENSTIYISSKIDDRFVYAHELGHAFDTRNLSTRERQWFLSIFGFVQDTEWAPARPSDDPYCYHMVCPIEIFANIYAFCALGLRYTANYGDSALFWSAGAKESHYGYGMKLEGSVLKQSCRAITTFKDPA